MPEITADVLRVACMRGDLSDLQDRILHAVTTVSKTTSSASPDSNPGSEDTTAPGPAMLRLLFACLRTLGVDFTPAYTTLTSQQVQRCTRCAASFRAADNTPTACAVPHAAPLVSYDIEIVADGVEPCETRYYLCCGTCVVVFPGQEEQDAGMCYVGPHVVHSVKHEREYQHPHEHARAFGVAGCADSDAGALAGAGKAHPGPQARRLPSVQVQVPGHWHRPGTSVPRSATGSEAGKSGPSPRLVMARTATWVNGQTAVQSAAGQHHHRHLLRRSFDGGSAGIPNSMGCSTMPMRHNAANIAAPQPVPARVMQTIPWRQSSLYHPPGWITVPPGVRPPGDSPFA